MNIINLPEALDEPIHRYGQNMFELFGLPSIRNESVVGMLGPNGIGKSTIIRILSGEMKPNLGNFDEEISWEDIISFFKGSQIQNYFKKLSQGEIKVVHKPQMVDLLPKFVKGTVNDLLEGVNQRDDSCDVEDVLELDNFLNRDIKNLSGGNCRSVAIAAAVLREADFYYFDEPTSWLDVRQRLNAVKGYPGTQIGKSVLVIEHDLALS